VLNKERHVRKTQHAQVAPLPASHLDPHPPPAHTPHPPTHLERRSLYTTHIFGASFGLGCSIIVSGQRPHENPDNAPRYQSNNYAILGSLFMFVPLFCAIIPRSRSPPASRWCPGLASSVDKGLGFRAWG